MTNTSEVIELQPVHPAAYMWYWNNQIFWVGKSFLRLRFVHELCGRAVRSTWTLQRRFMLKISALHGQQLAVNTMCIQKCIFNIVVNKKFPYHWHHDIKLSTPVAELFFPPERPFTWIFPVGNSLFLLFRHHMNAASDTEVFAVQPPD